MNQLASPIDNRATPREKGGLAAAAIMEAAHVLDAQKKFAEFRKAAR